MNRLRQNIGSYFGIFFFFIHFFFGYSSSRSSAMIITGMYSATSHTYRWDIECKKYHECGSGT